MRGKVFAFLTLAPAVLAIGSGSRTRQPAGPTARKTPTKVATLMSRPRWRTRMLTYRPPSGPMPG